MNRSTLYVFEDSFKILDERFVRLEPWLFSFFFFSFREGEKKTNVLPRSLIKLTSFHSVTVRSILRVLHSYITRSLEPAIIIHS